MLLDELHERLFEFGDSVKRRISRRGDLRRMKGRRRKRRRRKTVTSNISSSKNFTNKNISNIKTEKKEKKNTSNKMKDGQRQRYIVKKKNK